MAAYTTPLSAPRRQQAQSSSAGQQQQQQQQQQQKDQHHTPQQHTRVSQLALAPPSSLSPTSTSPLSPAIPRFSPFNGGPMSGLGPVRTSTTVPPSAAGAATLAPGRRLQYQLPVSSRLDGNNHYVASVHQQYQYQQQHQGVPGTTAGGNSNSNSNTSTNTSTNVNTNINSSSNNNGNNNSSNATQGNRINAGTGVTRPLHAGTAGTFLASPSSPGPSTVGSTALSHPRQQQQQQQQQRLQQQHAQPYQQHRQLPQQTLQGMYGHIGSRNDGGLSAAGSLRGSHMGNVQANTNTQTMMVTGTTTTGTTNQTGMTDKPKSRKKDKPPRIPPPDQIYDNNGKITYTRGPPLGEGGFASCYIISDQKNGRFAAKVIQKSDLPTYKTKQKLFSEIKIHQGLTNENIVKYYHCFEDDDFVYLVLELCESKTLMELLKRRKRLTEPEVRYYMKEIVAGCLYLHREASVIHRDLKLGNIFLTHDLHVRIGDFGLAALIVKDERKRTICGTPNYIAPEILFDTDNGHSFEVDIWSVGVIMYTLLIGKPPFQTNEVKAIYKRIRDNNYVFPDDVHVSDEAKSLVAALLTPTPASRPSVVDVLNHPFFSSGYCPEKLDRRTLQMAPNYEQEELRLQQQLEQERNLEDALSSGAAVIQPLQEDVSSPGQELQEVQILQTHPRQQLHYDQTSFADVLPSDQQARRHMELATDRLERSPVSSPVSLHNSQTHWMSQNNEPLQYTPTRSAVPHNQYQQRSPLANPRLQYGEQVRMELLDGDRVTTEIRTINVDRGHGAPSFPHLGQPRTRMQRDQQPPPSPARPGATVSLPAAANTTASRLPLPKSRLANNLSQSIGAQSPSFGHQMPQVSDLLSSTPTRQSFVSSFHSSSPRLPSSAAAGSWSLSMPSNQRPNMQESRHREGDAEQQQHQQQEQEQPLSASMLHEEEAFGAMALQEDGGVALNRRLPSRRQGAAPEQPRGSITRTQYRVKEVINPMDLDTDMDSNNIPPQHLDLLVADLSDVAQPLAVHQRRGKDQQQYSSKGLPVLSSAPPPSPQHDGNLFWHSPEQSRLADTAPGKNLYIAERPSSAMQRTFSQERELSGANPVELPRKMPRTVSSQLTASASSAAGSLSPPHFQLHSNFDTQSQPQHWTRHPYQQHSFLKSSQHGIQSPSHLQQQDPQHIPFPSALRLASWGTQLGPSEATSRNAHGQGYVPSTSPMHSQNASLDQDQEHSLQQVLSRQLQKHVGLGLSEPENAAVGGMVACAGQEDVPMTDVNSSSRDPGLQQQQQQKQQEQHQQRRQQSTLTKLRNNQTGSQKQPLARLVQSSTKPHSHMTTSSSSSSSISSRTEPASSSLSLSRRANKGESSFQDHSPRSQHTGIGSGVNSVGSDFEESSMEQGSNRETYESRRDMEQEVRSSQLRSVSRQQQAQPQQQQKTPARASGSMTAESRGYDNGVNHQRAMKQSNETTMAGMSSGGHSDEQDHVEVPSTSCATTASMSISMHRDHAPRQPMQDQTRGAVVMPHPVPESEGQSKQQGAHGRAKRADPPHLGFCEDVEQHLREMIHAHKMGLLTYPAVDDVSPRPPNLFLTRWINYARYGVGWHLTNGVIGVFCNDKTTLAVSPNGVDLEIMEPPPKRKAIAVQKKSTHKEKDPHRKRPSSSGSNSIYRRQRHASINNDGEITAGSSQSAQAVAKSMADMREVLEQERDIDARGVGHEKVAGLKNGSNATTHSFGGDTNQVQVEGSKTLDMVGVHGGCSGTDSGTVDFDDQWDHPEFLASLCRTNCKTNRYPSRFEKKMKVLSGFKNYMLQMLSGLAWAREDVDLTRGMPFLTDFFHKRHVVSRLSNGVIQINFADHTKMIFSERGRVVTFIDNDNQPRRVTLTVHQALTPEYFYDVQDEADQQVVIQTQLDQDAFLQWEHQRRDQEHGQSLPESGQSQKSIEPMHDHDLLLFPRPHLALKEGRQSRGPQRDSEDTATWLRLDLQDPSPSSPSLMTNPLALGVDASEVELVEITKEDRPAVICEMTFKQLHYELVRRLRLAQGLLQERRTHQADERKKERLEREQQQKLKEDNKRRRQQQQADKKERERESVKLSQQVEAREQQMQESFREQL